MEFLDMSKISSLQLRKLIHQNHEVVLPTWSSAGFTSQGTNSDSQLYSREHDLHECYGSDNRRDRRDRKDGWKLYQLHGLQRYAKRCYRGLQHYLQRHDGWRGVSVGDRRAQCWCSGDAGHHSRHRANHHYKQLVSVFSVIAIGFGGAVRAEDKGTTAIANPVATSSGSVSNQSVQINQGGYSRQSFGGGHACNSSTLTFTPFYLGNDVHPEYVRNQNYGIQMTFSIPLDREMVDLCKDLASKRLEKERLDYALIRALKCAELLDKGFMIRPESPYAVVCSDVVPIARAPKTESSSPVVSESVLPTVSQQVLEPK